MPVAGPALVHDLAGKHRIKIKRFLPHRQENIPLPAFHVRGITRYEPQQIRFRMRRDGGSPPSLRLGYLFTRQFSITGTKTSGFWAWLEHDVSRVVGPVKRLVQIDMLEIGRAQV